MKCPGIQVFPHATGFDHISDTHRSFKHINRRVFCPFDDDLCNELLSDWRMSAICSTRAKCRYETGAKQRDVFTATHFIFRGAATHFGNGRFSVLSIGVDVIAGSNAFDIVSLKWPGMI